MIITKLAGLGTETKIGNSGDSDSTGLEAHSPFVEALVLQF